jgi:septum formation protein
VVRVTLASASPQRKAILEQLGIAFDVVPSSVEELEQGEPEEVALENARRKAQAVEGELVLGVDTVVALDGRLYGKPRDEDEARAMFEALGGRTHTVVSGIHLRGGRGAERGRVGEASVSTAVTFRTIDETLARWYLQTGEWRGRAGGYAIQGRGAALVARIEGDYFNVVGLPVAALVDLLTRRGFPGFFA